jgi:hypothetical protein
MFVCLQELGLELHCPDPEWISPGINSDKSSKKKKKASSIGKLPAFQFFLIEYISFYVSNVRILNFF